MLFVIIPIFRFHKTSALMLIISTFTSISLAKSASYFNQTGQQVSFYKSPASPYPSGQTNLDRLTQNQIQKISIEESFYFYKNQKISKSILKTTTVNNLSNSENLRDLGFFQTLKVTAFRIKPDLISKQISTIPVGNKFQALGFQNGFVFAKMNKTTGYIDISDCISKFDFAKAVYAKHPIKKNKQWFYVKNRNFDQIETIDHQSISLNTVEGIFPDSKKAIITDPGQSLPIWTTLEIKTEDTTNLWHQSQIEGHGLVYWKNAYAATKNERKKIKIDELLKKEISFVSFNPKNPRQAIASAHGLFITTDGENWTAIEQFNDYSGPVLYYNEFLIFAGNYKSIDGGRTFENYIQIEKISAAISDTLGFDPKKLQVKKIKTIKPFKVEVDLDIGNRIIKVQTPVYAQDWRVVKL